jgi:PUA domain protein
LNTNLGANVFTDKDNIETATLKGFDTKKTYDLLFMNNQLIGILVDQKPMLTVRGLLKYRPTLKYITVDMGAVPYICNGADVMTPGIVDADPTIKVGDFVWMRDEKNMKPLAIGESLMSGDDLKKSEKGKGVRMIHWVGDDLWMIVNE